jgi:ADP-heptose:LPS heptosyltransferase
MPSANAPPTERVLQIRTVSASEAYCYLELESVYSIKFETIHVTKILYNVLLSVSVLLSRLRTSGILQKEHVKRILVVELTKLGDLVSNLSLFLVLKDLFPQASITVMVRLEHAGLFSIMPEVQTVLTSVPSRRLGDLLGSIHKVRRQKFDFVVSPSPSARQGVLVLLSGAKQKFGFLDYTRAKVVHLQPHRIRALGFQLPHPRSQSVINITERAARLCESLGARNPESRSALGLLGRSSTGQIGLNETLGLPDGTRYIIIHPFAGWSYRTWDLENFRQLVHRILESFSHHVLIIGAEADRQSLEPLIEEFGQYSRVRFGIGLPLDRLAAVMARGALFIGSDSGPLHLAAAVGVPIIGLFGPAPPELTGPPIQPSAYLYKKVECSPCDQEDCIRKWAPCISLITVEEVFKKINQSGLVGHESSLRQMAWPRTV